MFIYESPIQKMLKEAEAGGKPNLNLYFAGKDTIKDFVAKQDLIITVVDIAGDSSRWPGRLSA